MDWLHAYIISFPTCNLFKIPPLQPPLFFQSPFAIQRAGGFTHCNSALSCDHVLSASLYSVHV